MATSQLSTDEFLTRLATLFESRRSINHGSVFLTQKRLSPQDLPKAATDTPLPPLPPLSQISIPHIHSQS
ncbi:hypothetical protein ABVK25_001257 [Lepraria finkii]|uniref:Uncharacterized protein n=1 Tax=Lepraria finkii TaxID=1340010 RepID=A0ABR4BL50_9LECA